MAANALYRKHRPQLFAELVGQEHVTSALRHALLSDSVGHAYLFSGPRGTGKTTTARVFAKALNCLELTKDGEPCGKCVNCSSFSAEGITFPDLFELDAASNNGIDNIRDLISRVNLGMGATSKKKVYLIDEVHMLSTGAGNALLKTLEEPPSHVVFMLATTDPQKVLATVRSRTQHFDFSLLAPVQLRELLVANLDREGVKADDDALDLIVRKAAGSGRDSLSLLDQALALGHGALDTDVVVSMMGSSGFDRLTSILRAVAAHDPAGALVAAHGAFAAGVDVRRLADDLLRTLRDAFVAAAAAGKVPYDGPATEVVELLELAESFGLGGLTRSIEMLGTTIADIRSQNVADPRLLLEVALVRLARGDTQKSNDSLLERVERLEQRMARNPAPATQAAPTAAVGVPAVEQAPRGARPTLGAMKRNSPAETKPVEPPSESKAAESLPQLSSLDLNEVTTAWQAALLAMKAPLRASVQDARPMSVDGGTITFGIQGGTRFAMQAKKFKDEASAVRSALAQQLGTEPKFKIVELDPEPRTPAAEQPPPDEMDEYIDTTDLEDAPDSTPLDSLARLQEGFPGASVVEERPR